MNKPNKLICEDGAVIFDLGGFEPSNGGFVGGSGCFYSSAVVGSTARLEYEAVEPFKPRIEVTNEITMKQALKALYSKFGITEDAIYAALDGLPIEIREGAKIEFNRSLTVVKGNDVVNMISGLLNLTPAAVDDLFIYAATL